MTDPMQNQGRDGDVDYTDEQLDTIDRLWLGVGLALLLSVFVALLVGAVSWGAQALGWL